MARPAKLAVLVAAVAAGAVVLLAPWADRRQPGVVAAVGDLDGQWVGREAPNFDRPAIDGQRRQLSDYRGQVVFLNFWASFCKPCRREMPSMERLVRKYRDRGMVMVAVSQDEKKRDIRAFLDSFVPQGRTAMDVLWDPTGEVAEAYGTELLPETYIIDRDGRIVARFVNEYDWTRPEVKRLIEALLNE